MEMNIYYNKCFYKYFMKNCGIKSEILLDQKLITKENVMNNT